MDSSKRAGVAWLLAAMLLAGCAAPPPRRESSQQTREQVLRETIACTDFANVTGTAGSTSYFWRFVFRLFPYAEGNAFDQPYGCIQIQRNDDRRVQFRDVIPCTYKPDTGIVTDAPIYDQLEVDTDAFASPDFLLAQASLTFSEFRGKGYFECEFELGKHLQRARQVNSKLGISSNLPFSDTYAYFSLSAYVNPLSSTTGISGTLLAIVPQCQETSDASCQPSVWRVESDAQGGVRFFSQFNGKETLRTPQPFIGLQSPEAWWVGIRPQFDQLNMTDTLRIEHYQDVAERVDGMTRHTTTRYGNRYPLHTSAEEDVRMRFPLGPVKIYIGGGPSAEYPLLHGAFFQFNIDPGGSLPNGAG